MPAKSKKQFGLMEATLHGAKTGVPKKVAAEFVHATKHPGKLPASVHKSGKRGR